MVRGKLRRLKMIGTLLTIKSEEQPVPNFVLF